MTQTKAGGAKVKATNYALYGKDYYKRIGAMGGKVSTGPDYQKGGPKAIGFARYPELAVIAGAKGGSVSKRKPSAKKRKASEFKPVVKLTVTDAEMEQLNQLAEALQAEANVISY